MRSSASLLTRPDFLVSAGLVAGFSLVAVIWGYVLALGRPNLIGAAIGVLLGLILLKFERLIIWIILVGTLLVSGPVVAELPALSKLPWLFALLGFLMIGVAILYGALDRKVQPGKMPSFFYLAAIIPIYGVLSLFWSKGYLTEGIYGIKRYYQYWGLLLAFCIIPFSGETVRKWWKFLVALAVLQVPMALYQRLIIVPRLEGKPGFIALDGVSGTFEVDRAGGGSSSIMVFFCLIIFAYVLSLYRTRTITFGNFALIAACCIAPLLLGETKIVIVFLPLTLIAVFGDWISSRPFMFLMLCVLMLLMVVGLLWLYLVVQVTDSREMSLYERFQSIVSYNFGKAGHNRVGGLNRSTALTFWWSKHGAADPVAMMFGHGLGSSLDGEAVSGFIERRYPGISVGLTTASTLLWDLGLVGLLMFLGMLFGATLAAIRLARKATLPHDVALCRALVASMFMQLVHVFYSNSQIGIVSFQVLVSVTMGLVAWRARTGGWQAGSSARAVHQRASVRGMAGLRGA
ncbi:MAG: hypothetical protein R3E48_13070 [Burkholderiaceae bacterium]